MFKSKSKKFRFVDSGRTIGKLVEPKLVRVGDVVEVKNLPIRGIPNVRTRTMLIIDISLRYSGGAYDVVEIMGKTESGQGRYAFVNDKRYTFRLLSERA